jgi:uncharacterized protein (DUF1697 family)
MRYAAFFRNLNLGRPCCPTRVQFETAFLEAGASEAQSFLTNGTIAFQAGGLRSARKILAAASQSMAARCGLKEPGFLRQMSLLARLVDAAPFASIDPRTVYGCYITFLHQDAVLPGDLPLASPRGDVKVIQLTRTEALCIAHKPGKSPGSPNAFLEKTLALPATTRAWNTVVRLVAGLGASTDL